MKNYIYKIQWLIPTTKTGLKEIKQIINICRVRSLDKICFRDFDLKIIDTYRDYIRFPTGVAEIETMKYIRKATKKDKKIFYVEILKR